MQSPATGIVCQPNKRLAFSLCLLLLVFTTLELSAPAAPLQLSGAGVQPVDTGVSYLIEGEQRLLLGQLRESTLADHWQEADPGPINFGYRSDPIWYRFLVSNQHGDGARYLELSYPLLDDIEFYQVHSNRIVERAVAGDRLPHGERPLDSRSFVFPLEVPPGQSHEIYLRVQTSGAHQVPMRLWQPTAFYQHSQRDLLERGMFYGMLLIMATFNLLLYFAMRDRSFVLFFGVQALLLASMSTLHGVAFQYLFPNNPWLHEAIILIAVPLAVVFFCLFCADFLNLRTRFRPGFWVVMACAGLCGVAAIGGAILPYAVSTRFSVALIAVVCLVILAVGLVLAWRGDRSGRLFVLAWFALLLGVVGHILNLSGFFSSLLFMSYAMETGAVLASLVFSFALGDRFHRERQARIEEQQARIQAMHERELAEARIVHSARHHYLTGLPNRAALEQCLAEQIADTAKQGGRLALVMLHLRGFDDINKTLGHENADGLLCQLATRLNDQVAQLPAHIQIDQPESGPVACAHVEGITFACVFRTGRRADVFSRMQVLARGVQQPIKLMGLSLSVGVVGGCAFYPDDSQDVPTLLRHAFIAFDRASNDVSGMAMFTDEGNAYSARRLTLMTELQWAIDNHGLALYFQPQVCLADARLFGFEALIRWNHPEHGFVPPDEFIPIAERGGMMQPLTHWVLDQAMAFLGRLESNGHLVSVSVNISAINLLDPGFVDSVSSLLDEHRLDAHRLVLEVTETAAMQDPEAALEKLRRLSDRGVRLSIDDFGTGYSSLSYIRQLPVHEIKIDRSFVMEIDRNSDDATIVRTTVNMCHDLGYKIVAEGVETQSGYDLLAQMGCDVAQGYFLARPMPEDQVFIWLAER